MPINITSIEASSNGAWQGDSPINYAFPLLIIQTSLVLFTSHFLAFLFKPLRQPKVIAEIIGGILLGPSALGRNKAYLDKIFPPWSEPILETVASIGLLFFLFLVGLELDLNSIRRSGRKAFSIALAGVTLPFVLGIGVALVLRKTVKGAENVGFAQFVVFIGVSLSITAFPVLARILAELKLLTTQVGETAMAAAAFNDVVAWVLLALAVALASNGSSEGKSGPLVSIWVLLSGIAFVSFMLLVVKPAMTWVAKRCSNEHQQVNDTYICLTLVGVIISGFMTDLIGIHSIFGAFVFGLTIPKEGEFAGRLIERTEDFVSGLLLPLYFASSGLKTDIAKIRGVEAWGLLVLVVTTACVGKILGTFLVAIMNNIPPREAITLGLLMNTKGLVELIVLNIGKEKKVLNDEIFAILILMAIFATFMTTPSVMAIYKPARGATPYTRRKLQQDFPHSPSLGSTKKELRLLACVRGPGNVSSLMSLVESTRTTTDKSLLKLYVMHLKELTDRPSSILMVQRARRNGLPFVNRLCKDESHDGVALALKAYNQLERVKVLRLRSISDLPTMHEDVCHIAEEKRVTMLILPFHKHGRRKQGEEGEVEMENAGHGWKLVNQRVLQDAPCSVAVLIDRGLGVEVNEPQGQHTTDTGTTQGVCVVFFGGTDDREALELGGRMAEHPGINVTVLRFVSKNEGHTRIPAQGSSIEMNFSFSNNTIDPDKDKEQDEQAITEFRKRWDGIVTYMEKEASKIVEEILAVGKSGEFELIIVGRSGRLSSTMVAELRDLALEHEELGPVGDILALSGHGLMSSVLVIQQYDVSLQENEAFPVSSNINDGCSTSIKTTDASSPNISTATV